MGKPFILEESRGSEAEFQAILSNMSNYIISHETDPKNFGFIRLNDALDAMFDGRYHWTKNAFYEELAKRTQK